MEKQTLAEKITELKRKYLQALQGNDLEQAKELRAVILWAEKLNFPPDQEYPIFIEFTFTPMGNYLVKTKWLDVDVEMTPNEFDGLKQLKQTVFLEEIKSYPSKIIANGSSAILIGDVDKNQERLKDISLDGKTIVLLPDNKRDTAPAEQQIVQVGSLMIL